MKTLLIDNYDSFTFNLFQLLAEVNGKLPTVIKNDEATWPELAEMDFDSIVISPGPGTPEKPQDFGVCSEVLRHSDRPVLGVCMGHQGLALAFGGSVVHAPEPVHGRVSPIYHDESPLYAGLPQGFTAVRYHSLMVGPELPECLLRTAWTTDGLIMGIRHATRPLWGVQFHPESACSEYGVRLLRNFRDIVTSCLPPVPLRDSPSIVPVCAPVTKAASHPPASPDRASVLWRALDILPEPEAVFTTLYGDSPFAFWLDSSSSPPSDVSRFSYMGDAHGPHSEVVSYWASTRELSIAQPNKRTAPIDADVFDFLARRMEEKQITTEELPFRFNCGYVGYIGYEVMAKPGPNSITGQVTPDATFIFADRLLVFDHYKRKTYLVCYEPYGSGNEAQKWFDDVERRLGPLISKRPDNVESCRLGTRSCHLARPRSRYLEDVRDCLRKIRDGESYELCLTNKIRAYADIAALDFYRRLRRSNPAPFSAYFRFGSFSIACSSPERFLMVDEKGWAESRPIKGTIARGPSTVDDELQKNLLRTSVKDRSENLMIVDLVRNDLGRVCEPGTVTVHRLMDIETHATVHQMVSTIRGRLRGSNSSLDCIRAAFPGGSMTGAPKIRAMSILRDLEAEPRGIYSGTIGFLALNGSCDLNIAIRTALLAPRLLEIGIGGAVVSLSDPETEFNETLLKGHAVLQALDEFSGEAGYARFLRALTDTSGTPVPAQR
ncbi:MAG: aminodeoxychorismate synthase component I [Bryobacteraceae bacterium]